ncbi:MAG TPA: HflK protein, partial [Pseudothermotoga sp.]|nr:HflK protein [Pseudothermotoga sp.]
MKTKVIVLVIVVVALFLYLATGVYQVNPSQVALVKTFGKYSHTSGPGIHFHA